MNPDILVKNWLKRAKAGGCSGKRVTHVIIYWSDTVIGRMPAYKFLNEEHDIHDIISKEGITMCDHDIEIYNMSMDIEKQMAECRAYHP